MSIHKSLVTSAVPSDCVVGAVALNCGPFGDVVEYAVAYPTQVVPLCVMMSASSVEVSYHSVPSAGSLLGELVEAV